MEQGIQCDDCHSWPNNLGRGASERCTAHSEHDQMKVAKAAVRSWRLSSAKLPRDWARALAATIGSETATNHIIGHRDTACGSVGHYGIDIDEIDSTQDAAMVFARRVGAIESHGAVVSARR